MGIFDKIFGGKKEVPTEKPEPSEASEMWFVFPTVSNEFPQMAADPTESAFDIHIHEDDYRQSEFLRKTAMPLIEEEFEAIGAIWRNSSKRNANFTLFKHCHVRNKIGTPQLTIPFAELLNVFGVTETGAVKVNGETLAESFAFKTAASTFYGLKKDEIVTELCMAASTENTIEDISSINAKYNLVFVNWCQTNMIQEDEA